ncbi:hypothetical protein C5E44_03745 [Nocardia nova]|nr:hypothetical protein C5E44_03745 [Nocardia nova]
MDVESVEQQPQPPEKQAVLAEQRRRAGADTDEELLAAVRQLLVAVHEYAPQAAETVGVRLRQVNAGELEISDVTSVGNGVIDEDIIVTGLASPYRGLGWSTDTDAAFFFGRDAAIDTMLHRLSRCACESGVLMVSGGSGAGKTSLLCAGVLPRIAGEGLAGAPEAHRWPRAVITPGHAPLDELALAESHGHTRWERLWVSRMIRPVVEWVALAELCPRLSGAGAPRGV